MTHAEALELAQREFERYQELFLIKEAENPELSMEEVGALVEYEHPVFDDPQDEEFYDAAMLCVGLGVVLDTL